MTLRSFRHAIALIIFGATATSAAAGTQTFGAQSTGVIGGDITIVLPVDTAIFGDATLTLTDLAGDLGSNIEFVTGSIDGVNLGEIYRGVDTLGDCLNYGDRTLVIPKATLEPLIADGSVTIVLAGTENDPVCLPGGIGTVGAQPGAVSFALSGGSLVFDSGVPEEETATQNHLAQSGGALLRMQPDLRGRVGNASGSANADVSQGVGFANLDTGAGPIWATLKAERQDANGSESLFGLASLGVQWDTGERSASGLLLQFDTGRSETTGGVETTSRGFMTGVYTVQQMGGLTFDGRILGGLAQTDLTSGANTANDIGGTRALATVQLSGSHTLSNGHAVKPHASVEYVRQTLDSYTIGGTTVADQSQTLGEAVLGGDWEIPLEMSGGMGAVTLGAGAHYAFQQTGATVLPDTARGRADVGLSFTSSKGGPKLDVACMWMGWGLPATKPPAQTSPSTGPSRKRSWSRALARTI